MHASKLRRTISLIAAVALTTSLTIAAVAAPAAAAPDEQKVAAKAARAEARAAAKAERQAAKEERAAARAAAKAERQAAKEERAAARAAAKEARGEKVTVCHKPGTPAEGTLEIAAAALDAHLAHGDTEGACDVDAVVTQAACEEPESGLDEGDGVACEEPPEVLVSIDGPEMILPQDELQLEASVSGLDTDDVSYAWSSTCLTDDQMADPEVVTSEPGTTILTIAAGVLTAGTTCDFTLTVTDETPETVGSATATVEVLSQP